MFTDYEVLDNFLEPDHFNKLKNLDLKKLKNREIKFTAIRFLKMVKLKILV